MKFELPTLPYAMNALEPVISQRTLEFHYGKHFAGYINTLNTLIQGTEFEEMDLTSIVKQAVGAIFNNAAQAWNHNFYFATLQAPTEHNVPKGAIGEAILMKWGSFEKFQEAMVAAGATTFGSGWAWLSKDINGDLEISSASNAGNPILNEQTPLLTLDVWEHAYYLDYQNRRPDHLKEMFRIINWDVVEERYI